jgi:hypothetical protein
VALATRGEPKLKRDMRALQRSLSGRDRADHLLIQHRRKGSGFAAAESMWVSTSLRTKSQARSELGAQCSLPSSPLFSTRGVLSFALVWLLFSPRSSGIRSSRPERRDLPRRVESTTSGAITSPAHAAQLNCALNSPPGPRAQQIKSMTGGG